MEFIRHHRGYDKIPFLHNSVPLITAAVVRVPSTHSMCVALDLRELNLKYVLVFHLTFLSLGSMLRKCNAIFSFSTYTLAGDENVLTYIHGILVNKC